MSKPAKAPRWELSSSGVKLHWPAVSAIYVAVCGRPLDPVRTNAHRMALGSPMPYGRCKTCLRMTTPEARAMDNP